jgi:hypothetical protein
VRNDDERDIYGTVMTINGRETKNMVPKAEHEMSTDFMSTSEVRR